MQSSEGFVFIRPGLHLYYRVLGDPATSGETLVVPNASWLAEPLTALAEGRRVILYDPRSRGRSSTVTDRRQLSIEDDVRDLEILRRYFGLDRMALLGSSYHAAISALYTIENPERVTRLLLVCPITPFQPGEWAQETPSSDVLVNPPGVPRLDEMRREGVDKSDPVAYCRAWFNYFLLPAQMADIEAASRFPVDDVCSFPNEWPSHALGIYFEHIIPKMKDWDFRPRLERLEMPVLVVQGTDDLVPVQASRAWAEHCPHGRFLPMPGTGHHPYLERPQEFFAAADAFLRGEWPPRAEIVRPAA